MLLTTKCTKLKCRSYGAYISLCLFFYQYAAPIGAAQSRRDDIINRLAFCRTPFDNQAYTIELYR